MRELARIGLTRCGYKVLEADRPAAALEVMASYSGRIDLLLTDVVMPGGNGRELAQRIAADSPGTRVLLMTGYTDDAIVGGGAGTGEHELLQKPFTPTKLAQKVRSVLTAAVARG